MKIFAVSPLQYQNCVLVELNESFEFETAVAGNSEVKRNGREINLIFKRNFNFSQIFFRQNSFKLGWKTWKWQNVNEDISMLKIKLSMETKLDFSSISRCEQQKILRCIWDEMQSFKFTLLKLKFLKHYVFILVIIFISTISLMLFSACFKTSSNINMNFSEKKTCNDNEFFMIWSQKQDKFKYLSEKTEG